MSYFNPSGKTSNGKSGANTPVIPDSLSVTNLTATNKVTAAVGEFTNLQFDSQQIDLITVEKIRSKTNNSTKIDLSSNDKISITVNNTPVVDIEHDLIDAKDALIKATGVLTGGISNIDHVTTGMFFNEIVYEGKDQWQTRQDIASDTVFELTKNKNDDNTFCSINANTYINTTAATAAGTSCLKINTNDSNQDYIKMVNTNTPNNDEKLVMNIDKDGNVYTDGIILGLGRIQTTHSFSSNKLISIDEKTAIQHIPSTNTTTWTNIGNDNKQNVLTRKSGQNHISVVDTFNQLDTEQLLTPEIHKIVVQDNNNISTTHTMNKNECIIDCTQTIGGLLTESSFKKKPDSWSQTLQKYAANGKKALSEFTTEAGQKTLKFGQDVTAAGLYGAASLVSLGVNDMGMAFIHNADAQIHEALTTTKVNKKQVTSNKLEIKKLKEELDNVTKSQVSFVEAQTKVDSEADVAPTEQCLMECTQNVKQMSLAWTKTNDVPTDTERPTVIVATGVHSVNDDHNPEFQGEKIHYNIVGSSLPPPDYISPEYVPTNQPQKFPSKALVIHSKISGQTYNSARYFGPMIEEKGPALLFPSAGAQSFERYMASGVRKDELRRSLATADGVDYHINKTDNTNPTLSVNEERVISHKPLDVAHASGIYTNVLRKFGSTGGGVESNIVDMSSNGTINFVTTNLLHNNVPISTGGNEFDTIKTDAIEVKTGGSLYIQIKDSLECDTGADLTADKVLCDEINPRNSDIEIKRDDDNYIKLSSVDDTIEVRSQKKVKLLADDNSQSAAIGNIEVESILVGGGTNYSRAAIDTSSVDIQLNFDDNHKCEIIAPNGLWLNSQEITSGGGSYNWAQDTDANQKNLNNVNKILVEQANGNNSVILEKDNLGGGTIIVNYADGTDGVTINPDSFLLKQGGNNKVQMYDNNGIGNIILYEGSNYAGTLLQGKRITSQQCRVQHPNGIILVDNTRDPTSFNGKIKIYDYDSATDGTEINGSQVITDIIKLRKSQTTLGSGLHSDSITNKDVYDIGNHYCMNYRLYLEDSDPNNKFSQHIFTTETDNTFTATKNVLNITKDNVYSNVPVITPSGNTSNLTAGHLCRSGAQSDDYSALIGHLVMSNSIFAVWSNTPPFDLISLPKNSNILENMTEYIICDESESVKNVMVLAQERSIPASPNNYLDTAVGGIISRKYFNSPGTKILSLISYGECAVKVCGNVASSITLGQMITSSDIHSGQFGVDYTSTSWNNGLVPLVNDIEFVTTNLVLLGQTYAYRITSSAFSDFYVFVTGENTTTWYTNAGIHVYNAVYTANNNTITYTTLNGQNSYTFISNNQTGAGPSLAVFGYAAGFSGTSITTACIARAQLPIDFSNSVATLQQTFAGVEEFEYSGLVFRTALLPVLMI